MTRLAVPLTCVFVITACAGNPSGTPTQAAPQPLPRSMGEAASNFGYVPLDGLAVHEVLDYSTCYDGASTTFDPKSHTKRPLLSSLPDLSVRFAVAAVNADGGLSFGPAKVTAEGGTYRAVLDYVNVDALPVEFYVRKYVRGPTDDPQPRSVYDALRDDEVVTSYEVHLRDFTYSASDSALHQRRITDEKFGQVTVPVYVGIGMRLTADIRAIRGGITLASLGSIGAEAQANGLSGTLTVQTLGLTGKSIATALPLPSKLDQTTVENGILALGSSRAVIYTDEAEDGEVTKTARIVGLYSPVGSDPRLINGIYSELSRARPTWTRHCTRIPS